ELLLSNLTYKSFIDFTTDLIGPWAGYFVGWTYWLCWITIGIADLSAIIYYTHLWANGGFFPTGVHGFLAGFQIAIFAFVGVELVGTTAAETKDPERNLP
ncbi:hypothetical protein L6C91_13925, partial [Staphylococcus aureus]|nr:hypothetical protein [Staphylococcus aureus]